MSYILILSVVVFGACQSAAKSDLTQTESQTVTQTGPDGEKFWLSKGAEQKWVMIDSKSSDHKSAREACYEHKTGQTWILPTATALEKAIDNGILSYIKEVNPEARYVWVDGLQDVTYDLLENETTREASNEPHEFLCVF